MTDGESSQPGEATNRVRRFLIEPFRRFLAIEAASGILLVGATALALVWVNLGSATGYEHFWSSAAHVSWAGRLGGMDLHTFVNDALMTLFFFVVGLEIKLEWFQGALRDRRFARLPIVAALGGMIVPAVLYFAIARGTVGQHGWGIPMATDIAFVVGVMALLGSRVPQPIKVFLLTLAIVDDLGAIVVIAVFYASDLQWTWLGFEVLGLVAMVVLRRLGVQTIWVYVVVGLTVWYFTWQSGVHATIAGVAIAFLTPLQVRRRGDVWSPLGDLLERLHPWSSFVVVPLFALANAGVALTGSSGADGTRVAFGIIAGLLVGKCVGVAGASWCAVKLRAAALPGGVRWSHLIGAGLLAGIGFTMSLFITELAFTGGEAHELADAAKRAILGASVTAAILGSLVFAAASRNRGPAADRDG